MTTKPHTQSPHVSAIASFISFTMINSLTLSTDSDNCRSGNSGQNQHDSTTSNLNGAYYCASTTFSSENSRHYNVHLNPCCNSPENNFINVLSGNSRHYNVDHAKSVTFNA